MVTSRYSAAFVQPERQDLNVNESWCVIFEEKVVLVRRKSSNKSWDKEKTLRSPCECAPFARTFIGPSCAKLETEESSQRLMKIFLQLLVAVNNLLNDQLVPEAHLNVSILVF